MVGGRLLAAAAPDSRLFIGPKGGRISTAVLRDATHWDDVVKELGHEHLVRHDLRHTGLTWINATPATPSHASMPDTPEKRRRHHLDLCPCRRIRGRRSTCGTHRRTSPTRPPNRVTRALNRQWRADTGRGHGHCRQGRGVAYMSAASGSNPRVRHAPQLRRHGVTSTVAPDRIFQQDPPGRQGKPAAQADPPAYFFVRMSAFSRMRSRSMRSSVCSSAG
jgi:hypothetical protein